MYSQLLQRRNMGCTTAFNSRQGQEIFLSSTAPRPTPTNTWGGGEHMVSVCSALELITAVAMQSTVLWVETVFTA
jgi:hypothetical protein